MLLLIYIVMISNFITYHSNINLNLYKFSYAFYIRISSKRAQSKPDSFTQYALAADVLHAYHLHQQPRPLLVGKLMQPGCFFLIGDALGNLFDGIDFHFR